MNDEISDAVRRQALLDELERARAEARRQRQHQTSPKSEAEVFAELVAETKAQIAAEPPMSEDELRARIERARARVESK